MPIKGKKSDNGKEPKSILTRIVQVFETGVVGEIEKKELNEAIDHHKKILEDERKIISQNLKAQSSGAIFQEIEKSKKD